MNKQNCDISAFTPLREYGAVGDCRSLALISRRGSIDWCCFPKFDAPSVFAAILDPNRGGHFRIQPTAEFEATQEYIRETNVLKETFRTSTGSCELVELMPCFMVEDEAQAFNEIHRMLRCTEGEMEISVDFSPRMNYAQGYTIFEPARYGCVAKHERECILLSSSRPLEVHNSCATARFTLKKDERAWLVLRYNDEIVRECFVYRSEEKLQKTIEFWEDWSSRTSYSGRWRDAVARSALLLRMLVYQPSGPIIAAPTTSLPEISGGHKNWDYRYSWLRDSAMTVWALYLVGHHSEKRRYMRWVRRRLRGQVRDLEHLRILHGVEGDATVTEKTLDHLNGYCNSRPVRIGNAAYDQFQLDTYGSLIDAIHFTYDVKKDMTDDIWRIVQSIADFISKNWKMQDFSIWELRGRPLHYTYSKVMCWVAMDRAQKIAMLLGDREREKKWSAVREEIRDEIMEKCINKEMRSFVQSQGSKKVDASLLSIPLVGFLSVKDPIMTNTIKMIRDQLEKDKMVFRFKSPSSEADGGSFMMCSFWLVQCLALMGEIDLAVEHFEHLLSTSNHLGLYSEVVVPHTHEFLGNFPQGLSHISLIITAQFLSKAVNMRDNALLAEQPIRIEDEKAFSAAE